MTYKKQSLFRKEKTKASAIALNADIYNTKVKLLEEFPKLQILVINKVTSCHYTNLSIAVVVTHQSLYFFSFLFYKSNIWPNQQGLLATSFGYIVGSEEFSSEISSKISLLIFN